MQPGARLLPPRAPIGRPARGRGLRGHRPERDESPGKMAAAGSSEPGCPPCPATSRAPAQGSGGVLLGPPEDEEKSPASCGEAQPDCRPPPAHPASGTQRHICFGLQRRSDPEKSSSQPGRKDCDTRRGQCGSPGMGAPWRRPGTPSVARLQLWFKFSSSRRPGCTDRAERPANGGKFG